MILPRQPTFCPRDSDAKIGLRISMFIRSSHRFWLRRQDLGRSKGFRFENGRNRRLRLEGRIPARATEYSVGDQESHQSGQYNRRIKEWRRHYNTVRPHSSLGYRPPAPQTFNSLASPQDQVATMQ
ncbi:MAG: integrase core domain-containing protein [Alphaproteobacteria bacterium]